MILSIQKLTPEVYTAESRDFQILGSLFNAMINGVKNDSDSIVNIINTQKIRGNFLELLETKFGLNLKTQLTEDELRYVLRAFPYMIRAKGSKKAVEQMITTCLKIFNVNATFKIEKVSGTSVVNNVTLDSHSYLIGMNTVMKNASLLAELSKYIMPPGFTLFVYVYMDYAMSDDPQYSENVDLLFASDNINSVVRSHYDEYDPSTTSYYVPGNRVTYNNCNYQCISNTKGAWKAEKWQALSSIEEPLFVIDKDNRLVGAIDTINFASTENNVSNKYRGVFISSDDLPTLTSSDTFDVCIVEGSIDAENGSYIWNEGSWHKIDYLGTTYTEPTAAEDDYSIIGVVSPYFKTYFRYDGSQWIKMRNRGSIQQNQVISPVDNDFINPLEDGTRKAYYRSGTEWKELNDYKDVRGTFPTEDISTGDYCFIDGASYRIYLNGKWNDCSAPIYILSRASIS